MILSLAASAQTFGANAAGTETALSVAGAGGVAISCTLMRPATPSPVAAMLLIQGSGPVDRNGAVKGQHGSGLEGALAAFLAGMNVASLRCDKRGQGANEAGIPADHAKWQQFFSWDNSVGDITAEWRALIAQKGIAAAHSGIFGHSEGGLIALAAEQSMSKAPGAPAWLVLAATPGRPIGDVIQAQLASIMQRRNLPQARQDAVLAKSRAIQQAVSSSGVVPPGVPPGLRALYPDYIGAFLRGEEALDPAALAQSVPAPVLLVVGSADQQVSPEADTKRLDQALGRRRRDAHHLAILPGDTHALTQPDTPTTDPAALAAIAAWLSPFLASRS